MRESAVNEMGMGQALGCNSLLSEMRIPYPSHLSRNIMIINHWIGVPLRKSTSRISPKMWHSQARHQPWAPDTSGLSGENVCRGCPGENGCRSGGSESLVLVGPFDPWSSSVNWPVLMGMKPKTKIRHHQRAAGSLPIVGDMSSYGKKSHDWIVKLYIYIYNFHRLPYYHYCYSH